MNQEIVVSPPQTSQSDSFDWVQSYGEIVCSYYLSSDSTDSSDLSQQIIKQNINKLLSFLDENHIQAQAEFDTLNEILNKIKSSEISTENERRVENNPRTFQYVYEDYMDFMERIESIKGGLKDIMDIKDYQTKKMELEKLVLRKPSLQEATELKDWMKGSGCDLYDQEIKILQGYISTSEKWNQKVRDCLGKYERYVIDDEVKIEPSQVKEITRGISMLKEEMNQLILKEEEAEAKITIFEWRFQAKLFLSSGDSDIKYWKDLLKKAQHKEILERGRYTEICKQVVKYDTLIEQVKEIQDQEQEALLLKLADQRIGLKDQESLEGLLKELTECKVLTLREESYLKGLLDQAKKALMEYRKVKASSAYIPIKKFQAIVKQLKKLPIRLPHEINDQILKEERINELLKEVIDKPSFDIASKIYHKYEGCYLDVIEAQEISRAYSQVTGVLQMIEDTLEHRRDLDYEEICELETQVDNSPLDLGPELYTTVKVQIWLIQVGLIKMFKENARIRPEKLIPLQKVYEYLAKGCEHLDNIPKDNQKTLLAVQNFIHFLNDLLLSIEEFFAKISHTEDPRKEICPYSRFIDMEEKILEVEAAAALKKVSKLSSSLLQKRQEPLTTQHQDEVLMKKVKTGDGFFGVEQRVSEEEISIIGPVLGENFLLKQFAHYPLCYPLQLDYYPFWNFSGYQFVYPLYYPPFRPSYIPLPPPAFNSAFYDLINHFNNHSNGKKESVSSQTDELEDDGNTHLVQLSENEKEVCEQNEIEFVIKINEEGLQNLNNQLGKDEKTINQIFEGRISRQTNKGVYGFSGSLYTYASLECISQFPKISVPELSFYRCLFSNFLMNLKRQQNHEDSRFCKVLFGWVSVQTENPDPFAFEKNKKLTVGICSYIPGVEVYLLPLSSADGDFEKLKTDLGWTYEKNKSDSVPEQYLLFAICLTKSYNARIKRPSLAILEGGKYLRKEMQEGSEKELEKKKKKIWTIIRSEKKKEKKKIWKIVRPEKPERERFRRQRKAPVLVEPEERKVKITLKEIEVQVKEGQIGEEVKKEKRKRGRPPKQKPVVQM